MLMSARGHFWLTFNGQTTAPLAYNASAAAVDAALEALTNVGANNVQTSGGSVDTATLNVFFRRTLAQTNVAQLTANTSGVTGSATPTMAIATPQEGGWFPRPTGDDRRSTLNTNDLRGKILRIKIHRVRALERRRRRCSSARTATSI
jgi:hypothetical protein